MENKDIHYYISHFGDFSPTIVEIGLTEDEIDISSLEDVPCNQNQYNVDNSYKEEIIENFYF